MDDYDTLAKMMKALGHPIRLQILNILKDGEACVCHLEAVLGQRQASVSQHLTRLRDAGLVADRREDMFVYYSLRDDAVARLLHVAQEAVNTLSEREVIFQPYQGGIEDSCCCPKCEGQRTGILQTP